VVGAVVFKLMWRVAEPNQALIISGLREHTPSDARSESLGFKIVTGKARSSSRRADRPPAVARPARSRAGDRLRHPQLARSLLAGSNRDDSSANRRAKTANVTSPAPGDAGA